MSTENKGSNSPLATVPSADNYPLVKALNSLSLNRRRAMQLGVAFGLRALAGSVYLPLVEAPLPGDLEGLNTPSADLVNTVFGKYSYALGVGSAEARKGYVYETHTDSLGKFYTLRSQDGTFLLIANSKNEKGELVWRETKPRDLSDRIRVDGDILRVGIGVDYGNANHGEDKYKEIYRHDYNQIFVSSGFLDKYYHYGAGEYYTQEAVDNDFTLLVSPVFCRDDTDGVGDDVDAYMQRRVNTILTTILPLLENGSRPDVVIARDVFWAANGNVGWEGDQQWTVPNPFYAKYGEKWLAKAYLTFYRKAEELGFLPGRDYNPLIQDYDIEVPGLKADFAVAELQETKALIAEELGTDPGDVKLSVGLSFDLGNEESQTQIRKYLKVGRVQEVAVNVDRIREVIGPVSFTNIGGAGTVTEMGEFLGRILQIAESTQAKGVVFVDPMNSGDNRWTENLLYEKDTYAHLLGYYNMLRNLSLRTSS